MFALDPPTHNRSAVHPRRGKGKGKNIADFHTVLLVSESETYRWMKCNYVHMWVSFRNLQVSSHSPNMLSLSQMAVFCPDPVIVCTPPCTQKLAEIVSSLAVSTGGLRGGLETRFLWLLTLSQIILDIPVHHHCMSFSLAVYLLKHVKSWTSSVLPYQ